MSSATMKVRILWEVFGLGIEITVPGSVLVVLRMRMGPAEVGSRRRAVKEAPGVAEEVVVASWAGALSVVRVEDLSWVMLRHRVACPTVFRT